MRISQTKELELGKCICRMESEEKTAFFFYQALLQAGPEGTVALLFCTVACVIPLPMLVS